MVILELHIDIGLGSVTRYEIQHAIEQRFETLSDEIKDDARLEIVESAMVCGKNAKHHWLIVWSVKPADWQYKVRIAQHFADITDALCFDSTAGRYELVLPNKERDA